MLILSQKNKFLSKTIHRFPLLTLKFCCLPGKLGKNFYCLLDRRNSCHFFKLRVWRTAKTCACLFRFVTRNVWISYLSDNLKISLSDTKTEWRRAIHGIAKLSNKRLTITLWDLIKQIHWPDPRPLISFINIHGQFSNLHDVINDRDIGGGGRTVNLDVGIMEKKSDIQ